MKFTLIGAVLLFRNQSTGKPTKKHIMKNSEVTFCGWNDSLFAEVHINETYTYEADYCKKCLTAYKKLFNK